MSPVVGDAVDGYVGELAAGWAETDNIIERISQSETRLLDLAGVLEVMDTKLCGQARNLILHENAIPVRGDIRAGT